MDIQTFRDLYYAEPFRPFAVKLQSGEEVIVTDPRYMALDPTGRSIVVGLPDGTFTIVYMPDVADVELVSASHSS